MSGLHIVHRMVVLFPLVLAIACVGGSGPTLDLLPGSDSIDNMEIPSNGGDLLPDLVEGRDPGSDPGQADSWEGDSWQADPGEEDPGDAPGDIVGPDQGDDGTVETPDTVGDPGSDSQAADSDPGQETVLVDRPDPDRPGPYAIDMVGTTVVRGNRRTPAEAIMPLETEGPVPVVIFAPGFQSDSNQYRRTLEHLASHGFVVVRADPPAPLFGVDHREMAADLSAVLDWVLDSSGPLAGAVDPGRVAAMGHSLGGKVATMTAFQDSRVTALFGIDPVNGGGPTGYADSRPDIVPEQVAPLAIPVGFAGQTFNGTGSFLAPACAPLDQNFRTFYEAATSASWAGEWDFLGADHLAFMDPEECGFTCRLACPKGTADPADVVRSLRTLSTAFLRLHFDGEASMQEWLTGALVPDGIDVRYRE